MLAAMFYGRFQLEKDDDGCYFIDRNGRIYFGSQIFRFRDAELLYYHLLYQVIILIIGALSSPRDIIPIKQQFVE
jgi:hypothetical protein